MRALRRPRRRTPLSTTPIGVNHRLEQAALYSPVQQRAAIASRRYRCERRVHRGAHAVHAFAGCALFGASTTALYSIDLLTGAEILIGGGLSSVRGIESLSPVPEPATWAPWLLGAAASSQTHTTCGRSRRSDLRRFRPLRRGAIARCSEYRRDGICCSTLVFNLCASISSSAFREQGRAALKSSRSEARRGRRMRSDLAMTPIHGPRRLVDHRDRLG
jgi:hypothetical protein